MDLQRELDDLRGSEGSLQTQLDAGDRRSKTSLRLKYEAEAEVLRRKLGDLETIRQSLGLSKRKICQLILVDPSAWTRWTKPGNHAPPHIYRMLQWYLAIEEKYPALDAGFWLQSVARPAAESMTSEKIQDLEGELRKVQATLREFSQIPRAEGSLTAQKDLPSFSWIIRHHWYLYVLAAILGGGVTLFLFRA